MIQSLGFLGTEWKEAEFWRDTIFGGIVRAQPREAIAPYAGRQVLMAADAFDAWREAQMRRRSQPAEAACQKWLEAAMREAPTRGPKPKREWREDAKANFNVSGLAFDRIWAAGLQKYRSGLGPPRRAAQAPEIIESPHEN